MPTGAAAAAFATEMPTTPRHEEAQALSQRPEALGESGVGKLAAEGKARTSGVYPAESPSVPSLVPLDAVPVLAVPRTSVPWDDLGALATQLLLRLDGASCTMAIVTAVSATPKEGARELASLVSRGLVRLATQAEVHPSELELDMSVV
jgi:hypothetical protein